MARARMFRSKCAGVTDKMSDYRNEFEIFAMAMNVTLNTLIYATHWFDLFCVKLSNNCEIL